MIKDIKTFHKVIEPLENNLSIYTHWAIDTDGSKYRVKNSEVVGYKHHNDQLNIIFRQFQQRIGKGLYIIGNYLYFTLNGAKWYISLSCYETEEMYLDELIEQLKPIVSDIAYEIGRLD